MILVFNIGNFIARQSTILILSIAFLFYFQYIRLCPTTDMEHLWTLLTEHWKLPIPKLLISVTGGAQRFDLNPRLKAVFKRGLINAATTTGQ